MEAYREWDCIYDHGMSLDAETFMTKTVSKSQLKPKLLAYLRDVEESGEPLLITDHGRPVLKLVAYTPADERPRLVPGFILRFDDPTEPVGADEWEATGEQGATG